MTFIRSKSLDKAIYIGEYLKMSTNILKTDDLDFEDSWKFFKNQKSTKLSFTDCNIIKIMERYDIKNLATFDKEFSKVKDINVINDV
jgi:predicted nucleic acid-binding protein